MKKKHLFTFSAGLLGLILLNLISSQVFFRLDLTEDKRYTISDASRRLLEQLDAPVNVTVYLAGDLPTGSWERLQVAVRERLNEFKVYAGRNIQYSFVDPNGIADRQQRGKFHQQLMEKGVMPMPVFYTQEGQRIEKILFPYALVSYKDKETPVLLLQGNQAISTASSEQILNQSVEGVEFELASAIRQVTPATRKRIGLLEGYGRLAPVQLADLITSLQQNYDVFRVNLRESPSLQGLDAVIMARPDTAVSEADKYKIDQYIVNGGRALFFVDAMRLDSVSASGSVAFPYELNLDDLFFRYGVRLNPTLVQDLNSAVIPLNVGQVGDQPQLQPLPWRFFPLINNFARHPITRNMDAIYLRFAGTIDTVKAEGITKTPLLFTSRYTRVFPSPVEVSFNDASRDPDPKLYQGGELPMAYLLEGKFRSLYANRITQADPRFETFIATGAPSKVLVVSDGDMVINDVNPKTGQPLPLGLDRMSGTVFANKDFILHAVDYLVDEDGIIVARNKEIALRPLDKLRLREERLQWQLINLAAPVLLIVVFGIIRAYLRKRRYTAVGSE
jgi:ABC-2 type transport system permease protein